MPKRGLGRGLDVLIPTGDEVPQRGWQEVPIDAIVPNPHQPRMSLREQDLVELAASIQEHGIIQPLIVTRSGNGYQLIAGERRWRSARLAGLGKVPVVIKEVAPQQMLELALVENVQRADLNALEEALAYQQLVDEFGLTQTEVAKRVGKSRVAITNTIRLLQASEAIQQAVIEGQISAGHARALIGLPTHAEQNAALDIVLQQGLNVRQTESWVRKAVAGTQPITPQTEAPIPEIRALEERFAESLSTRVRLKTNKKGGGRVVIYYYSDEEFQALYTRLTGAEL